VLDLNEPSTSQPTESQVRLLPLFIAFSILTMSGAVLYTIWFDPSESTVRAEASERATTPMSSIPATPSGDIVKALAVRGRTIRVGDTADHIFEILKPEDVVSNEVWPDPAIAGSQVVRKGYGIDGGKVLFLTFRRTGAGDLLPYRLATMLIAAKSAEKEAPNVLIDEPSASARDSVAPSKKLDCYELSQYGKARGDSFWVVTEAVGNAQRAGLCTWSEQD
jgi:hypothetical protein